MDEVVGDVRKEGKGVLVLEEEELMVEGCGIRDEEELFMDAWGFGIEENRGSRWSLERRFRIG